MRCDYGLVSKPSTSLW